MTDKELMDVCNAGITHHGHLMPEETLVIARALKQRLQNPCPEGFVCVPRELTAEGIVERYEKATKTVPVGLENSQHGASVYNWRMAVIRDLRELIHAEKIMLAAAPGGEDVV